MTNKEIIEKLTNKDNFHKVVEICLNENIEIPRKGMPNLNIYHHIDGNKLRWSTIFNDGVWTFKTKDGKSYTNINDFFTHYENIIEFTHLTNISTVEYKVIPNIIKGKKMWYVSDDKSHYEISYHCHSLSSPAIIEYRYNNPKIYICKQEYYIKGMLIESKKEWQKLSRENKLSRICGVDLKKEQNNDKCYVKWSPQTNDDIQLA